MIGRIGAAVCAGLFACAALFSPRAAAEAPDPTLWRALNPEATLYIDTDRGRIVVEMYPEVAPNSVERIAALAGQGFYDGLTFHRVVDGFMAQGGDPRGDGTGASALPDLSEEFLFRRGPDMPFVEAGVARDPRGRIIQRYGFYKLLPIETQPDAVMNDTRDGRASAWGLHCPGVASMARWEDLDSANSQFFLMRAPYPSLDKRYTIWGRIVWGQEVLDGFPAGDPPNPAPIMTRVRLGADLPEGERLDIYALRTDSPAFRELIEDTRRAVRRDRERVFSLCDVQIPVLVAGVNDQERERGWWRILPGID